MTKTNEAKARKRQELIDRVSGKSDEPVIGLNPDKSYEIELNTALNWFANNADSKQRKSWVLSYYKKLKNNDYVEHFSELPDFDFHSLGALLRMKSRGSFLAEKEEQFIAEKVSELLQKQVAKKMVVTSKPTTAVVINIQDRILEKAKEVAGELDGQLDDFMLAGKPAGFKLNFTNLNSAIAKQVAPMYKTQLAEIEEAIEGEDEQLVEGYSNFTKPQLKRYRDLLQSIIDQCEQAKKIVRKPRIRKAKPAGDVVKRLKFKKEDTELGLKSVSAPTIVGATELWVYNTKYRKLQVYRAIENSSLTVKGTSILNYDTSTSGSKTLRKPKEQLTAMLSMTKRPLGAAYKAIKGKEATPNGRINEECILLKVF